MPVDHFIPRGEDIDYQINAEIFGFHILFDKDQVIHHLHPERGETFLSPEAVPCSKPGVLTDVVGVLPKILKDMDFNVLAAMLVYRMVERSSAN